MIVLRYRKIEGETYIQPKRWGPTVKQVTPSETRHIQKEHVSVYSPELPAHEGPLNQGGPCLARDPGTKGPGPDMGLLVQTQGSNQ